MLNERSNLSHFNTMLKEHQLSNSYLFFNFTRMSASAFEELLIIVGPDLQRSPSRPDVLCVGEIVGATLRFIFIIVYYWDLINKLCKKVLKCYLYFYL